MKLNLPQTVEVFINHVNLHGLRILHLSDLHINKKIKEKTLIELINTCNNLDYDFAVITGDIIDCKVKYIKEKLHILNTLSSKKPVYYISGNHDLVYGLEELKKELSNFIFMDNISKNINFNNNKICIVGLADRFSKFFKIKRDEKKVFNLLKENKATIFISHQPKDYKLAVNSQTDLFLCGHTHGGQIFPFHFFVRLIQPFLAGLFYKNKTAIYVNRGLGTWGIDYRYKADSEITILKLISKSVE
ncbi:MAG: serine/threonine protein phosphatase [Arcobacter sp.]|nr:MAG: serine/threonine protein phosphatase [Arcobacter sp.]